MKRYTPGCFLPRQIIRSILLGSPIIKKRKKLSDRELVKVIQESSYLQYFVGFEKFQKEALFTVFVLVYFRKWIDVDFLAKVKDMILENLASTKEYNKDNKNDCVQKASEVSDEYGSIGTAILDAAVSPSNIRYPQFFH